MIDKRKLSLNAISSVVQLIVSGAVLFLLYRFLLDTIGIERLGVWALVLATGSVIRGANLGLAGSIVKQVADYNAKGRQSQLPIVVQTSVITIALFAVILVLLFYPVGIYFLHFSLSGLVLDEAIAILPMALAAFWCLMVSELYLGTLYGCERIIHRNAIFVGDSLLYLGWCLVLAPKFGLLGLAYARLVQNILTLIIAVLLARRLINGLPIIPRVWDKKVFREVFGYAASFQIISLLVMLADPITKGFLGHYGSASLVGYYEMASRLVQFVRSIIANANQVLVPTFANLKQVEPDKIKGLYVSSYELTYYLSVPVFSLLAVAAPFVSIAWLGGFHPTFILLVELLCGGWLINTLSGPAYFASLGTGSIRMNLYSHLLMTVVNLGLIALIGQEWDGLGVVAAWVAALISGALMLGSSFTLKNSIGLHVLFPRASVMLTLFCLLGLVGEYLVWQRFMNQAEDGWSGFIVENLTLFQVSIITMATFFIVVAAVSWLHPIRRQFTSKIFRGVTG